MSDYSQVPEPLRAQLIEAEDFGRYALYACIGSFAWLGIELIQGTSGARDAGSCLFIAVLAWWFLSARLGKLLIRARREGHNV